MQTVSIGDSLHEMSNPVFWEKQEKYHQFDVCWISQESGIHKKFDDDDDDDEWYWFKEIQFFFSWHLAAHQHLPGT